MEKISLLSITLITLLCIFSTSAEFLYEVDPVLNLGEWEVSGNSLEQLDNPNHIFNNVNQKMLILTDSGNKRVKIYNQETWEMINIIDEFQFLNGSTFQPDELHETVQMLNGTFYSVIEEGKIIKYDSVGTINAIYTIPMSIPIGAQMHIAVDVNTTPNKILLSFFHNDYIDISVIDMTIYLTTGEIVPITSIKTNELQFSYNGTSPMLFKRTNTGSQEDITFLTFKNLIDNYDVLENSILYDSTKVQFNFNQVWIQSFLVIGDDYFVSTVNGYNGILVDNGKFSETIESIHSLGEIDGVTSMIYDELNERVVFVLQDKHYVVALKLNGFIQDGTTTSSSETNNSQGAWFANLNLTISTVITLFIILMIVVVAVILKLRKRS